MSDGSKPPVSSFSMIRLIIRIILRTRKLRRNLMFGLTLGMMIFVFLGAYPLAGFLGRHPWLFTFYWIFCTFLVLTTIFLAIYDMLRVTQEGRSEMEPFDIEELRRKVKEAQELESESKKGTKDEDRGEL